jgi:hypothetical protein
MKSITKGGLVTGAKSAIGATALQMTATSMPLIRGVTVKAQVGNPNVVYVGKLGVTANAADATDGYPLAANESVTIECDNANLIYVVAGGAGNKVFFVGV